MNNKITNAQRKALVGVVSEVMERKIESAKDSLGELTEKITQNVRRELGVDTIDNQIDALNNQIETLIANKKKLGFNNYDQLMKGSQAKALVDKRLEDNLSIKSLYHEKDRIISSIWTAENLSEAKQLVKSVLN